MPSERSPRACRTAGEAEYPDEAGGESDERQERLGELGGGDLSTVASKTVATPQTAVPVASSTRTA
jgi:hypothetical protein